jgi:uncharacterized membrane protein YjfL (UPF0719 family)
MLDTFYETLEFFPRGLVYVVLGIVVLYLAKWILDFVTPYHVAEQLGKKTNTALGLSITGYFLGVIIVFVAVLYSPSATGEFDWRYTPDFGFDVLQVFLYAMGAIVVLNLARYLVDRLVLYKFDVEKEIITGQNIGAGAVEFGVYLAVSLVIAAAIAGYEAPQLGVAASSTADELIRAVVFFLLGMGVLVVYALFYQITTAYDIHEEIEKSNLAVGITMAANFIAIALVTFKAVTGEFVGWSESLVAFATFAVIGFFLLLIVRWIIDTALFPKVKIADELAVAQNVGIAFIVGGVVISASLVLYFAI